MGLGLGLGLGFGFEFGFGLGLGLTSDRRLGPSGGTRCGACCAW